MKIGDYISLFSKQKWSLYALYILGLAAILPYTFYYVNNPDTFQYISLAQKISKGYFSLALNGYWSPLICWLISIPVFFGLDGIVSFKLVQILIGFFTIDAWLKLCSVVGFGSWYRSCLLYTSDAADERSSVDLGGRRIIKKKKKVETS